MLCQECGNDRVEEDFLGKDTCFRCQYKKKVEIIKNNKVNKCRQCNLVLESSRWVYCSSECAYKGKKYLDANYWENRIR